MNQEIIEKIQKLMRLGESPNENESAVALAQARKLMLKHGIEVDQLKDKMMEESVIEGDLFGDKSKRSKWETCLSNELSRVFSCKMIIRQKGNIYAFTIIGHPDDIAIVKYMYEFCMDTIERLYKAESRNVATQFENANKMKTYRESYKYGVVVRLIHMMKEKYQPTQQERALILRRDIKAQQYVDENLNVKTSKSRSNMMDLKAYARGHQHAEGVSLNRPIEGAGYNGVELSA